MDRRVIEPLEKDAPDYSRFPFLPLEFGNIPKAYLYIFDIQKDLCKRVLEFGYLKHHTPMSPKADRNSTQTFARDIPKRILV